MGHAAPEQWIVCVRDIAGGEDTYLGPYRAQWRATADAERLRRLITEHDGEASYDAIVEPLRSGAQLLGVLADLRTALDPDGVGVVRD